MFDVGKNIQNCREKFLFVEIAKTYILRPTYFIVSCRCWFIWVEKCGFSTRNCRAVLELFTKEYLLLFPLKKWRLSEIINHKKVGILFSKPDKKCRLQRCTLYPAIVVESTFQPKWKLDPPPPDISLEVCDYFWPNS